MTRVGDLRLAGNPDRFFGPIRRSVLREGLVELLGCQVSKFDLSLRPFKRRADEGGDFASSSGKVEAAAFSKPIVDAS